VFVDLAGGLDDEADTSAVNLAAPVTDGSHIVVPRLGEQSEEPGMINLNTADVDELDDLPGIGPALAEAIVAWREENGPFTAIEDLLNVPGIGESKLEDVRDRVVI
jgi:competence protein ComEA helix-hairpin-helix repeat region